MREHLMGSVMIDFLKYRWAGLFFSLSLIAAFVGVYFYKEKTRGYAFTYSVDFTGGTQTLMRFSKPVSVLALTEILEEAGWKGANVREFSPTEVLIRVKDFSNDAKGLSEKMREAIVTALPDETAEILQSEAVGPGVGDTLRRKAILAVLLAIIAMLSYIAIRFWSFGFALGAVFALFHDAIIILAAFLFFDREISINFIGAILMVLGYSINDTIVIFSQIRKNMKKMKGAALYDIVNAGLNQTLKRTFLTSISTGLTIGAMFVLGGEALRDLSFALLIGIVFGTYSSIYVASPVMMLFHRGKKIEKNA